MRQFLRGFHNLRGLHQQLLVPRFAVEDDQTLEELVNLASLRLRFYL